MSEVWTRPDDNTPLTDEQVRQIIDECKDVTKIVYTKSGGFFGPKLRVNYLQGRS